MSLASRHAPGAPGTTHTVLPAAAPNAVTGPTVPLPAGSHAGRYQKNSGRGGNSALMSLLNSGLSVPRLMMVQARGAQDNQHVHIKLQFIGTIGQGTFGQIERASLTVVNDTTAGENAKNTELSPLDVAVKRVLQDPRYKNRELSIMQRLNNHPNVVKFYYYYYSTSSASNRSGRTSSGRNSSSVDLFLHLVLECFPESLCELIYRYLQRNAKLPAHMVKVFTYQMLKALAYLHSHQICHRDIKSSNLLVDESSLLLKVCDFGSAKEMVPGTANVSYISSRYYRAPELLFGAQLYTCAIDTWSGGCVLAEMLRRQCLFMGGDSVDQLVKVIRVLGTPSADDIASMNPMYGSYNFPDVQSCPVKLFFPQHTASDLLALMSRMLVYNPTQRITPIQALAEPAFNELRDLGPNGVLPSGVRMPPHLLDPNPDAGSSAQMAPPPPPPPQPQQVGSTTAETAGKAVANNWHSTAPTNTSSSASSTSGKKQSASTDAAGKAIVGQKGRTSGVADKVSGHPGAAGALSSTETTGISKPLVPASGGTSSTKPTNPKRGSTTSNNSNGAFSAAKRSSETDGSNSTLSNGAAAVPGAILQSPKQSVAPTAAPQSDAPNTEKVSSG